MLLFIPSVRLIPRGVPTRTGDLSAYVFGRRVKHKCVPTMGCGSGVSAPQPIVGSPSCVRLDAAPCCCRRAHQSSRRGLRCSCCNGCASTTHDTDDVFFNGSAKRNHFLQRFFGECVSICLCPSDGLSSARVYEGTQHVDAAGLVRKSRLIRATASSSDRGVPLVLMIRPAGLVAVEAHV